jgi:ATP-dependent DNA helicase DinG
MARGSKRHSIDEILGPGGELSHTLAGYEYRREQMEVCNVIDESLFRGRHCLVEAGTGVGKSLAYLIPAVRAAERDEVTVISTHTINLQSQLIEKDIPLVASLFPDVKIKAVLMKGKGNYLCRQDLEAAKQDLFSGNDAKFSALTVWAEETMTGDVADLPFSYPAWNEVSANADTCRQKECKHYDTCFYYGMRRNTQDANIIVVNHALFLSDLVLRRTDPQGGILPQYDHVVFDEAHHLEDIATKAFGVEMDSRHIHFFIERVKRVRHIDIDLDRLDILDQLNDRLFSLFESDKSEFFFHDALDGARDFESKDTAAQISVSLERVQSKLLESAKFEEGVMKDRLQGLSRTAARLREELTILMFQIDSNYVRWGEFKTSGRSDAKFQALNTKPKRTVLHYTPIEVGGKMQELLWSQVQSVVLTSATLANSGGFSYLRSRLKIPPAATECIVGSPFDFKQQALLYVAIHLPAPPKWSDEDYLIAICDEMERILKKSGGRAFLLFTSRRRLEEVYEVLQWKLDYPLFKQGDMPAARLLDAFRESGNGCLFATQSFWEGVDVQGEALSCVIIDRIPFATPDSPVTSARTQAIEAAGGNWFKEYSIPQAQIRLKQGFGRLIRTHTDRGMVCILDSRLHSKPYGKEFVKHLPPASRAGLWKNVEKFWDKAPD